MNKTQFKISFLKIYYNHSLILKIYKKYKSILKILKKYKLWKIYNYSYKYVITRYNKIQIFKSK